MSKDEILAQLPEMSIEDLSAIKHEANKLMYERGRDKIDALIADPSSVLHNLDKFDVPQELKKAMDMNKEAILTAYGVMKSLNLITEERGNEPKQ